MGDRMAILKVKCSKCSAVVSTGVDMSYETFRSATLIKRTTECPKCGNKQVWTLDDVDKRASFEAPAPR
jgi:DNA-directed RNA polymerase subunit RPC12/RpoP